MIKVIFHGKYANYEIILETVTKETEHGLWGIDQHGALRRFYKPEITIIRNDEK